MSDQNSEESILPVTLVIVTLALTAFCVGAFYKDAPNKEAGLQIYNLRTAALDAPSDHVRAREIPVVR